MKFSIKKDILLESLNIVSHAISSKNIIPVLGGIKFDLKKEGLYLESSDNEIDIKVEVPASLVDNFIKFPILNYFKKKAIYKISIGKFNVYSKKSE